MAKVEGKKLKISKSIKVIKFAGDDITVKQYLPAKDKNSILELAMQQADQGTILNTFALDVVFHTYLVIKYSDIIFTNEEKEDIFDLYDRLESSGVMDVVLAAIPEDDYKELRKNLLEMVKDYVAYRNSARALVEQLTFFAPQAAENVQDIVKNMDPEKMQQIMQLADITGMNNKEKKENIDEQVETKSIKAKFGN